MVTRAHAHASECQVLSGSSLVIGKVLRGSRHGYARAREKHIMRATTRKTPS